ncbi:MAG: 50S ribosomal protein L37e [Candidatus Aenigmatarchaeota archaeon]
MSKGTPARGKQKKTLHVQCRRCGNSSFNIKKGYCASCGYGKSKKRRDYNWNK